MRELKLTYLDKVQEETNRFLASRIKHDFLQPDRDLSLDLTVREAEILIAANEEVRNMAETGGLQDLHKRYNDIHGRIETDYFSLRDYLAKTIQVVEGKENQLYDTLNEEYGLSLKHHGDSAGLLDVLGLASSDVSFENLSIVEGLIEKGHEKAHQLGEIRGWLHSYMGVKAHVYKIEADLKEQYANLVAKEDDATFANDEFRQLVATRDNYQATFSRWGVDDWAKNEYDTFIGTLNEVFQTKGAKLIAEFKEYQNVYNERQRIYHHFTREHESEAMAVFRTELLQHLAGSIVVKESRTRYQKEQFDRFIASL
jgi:hypothetical protein